MTKQDRDREPESDDTGEPGDGPHAPEGRFTSYSDFWQHYLRQHSMPGTRRAHFAGTALVLAMAVVSIGTQMWLLLLVLPVIGYGFAWAGHFLIEGNRPATFGHPLWSLYSDFRMFFLWCRGKLDEELISAGILDHSFQYRKKY